MAAAKGRSAGRSAAQAMRDCIEARGLASVDTPVLLMVSGGSDSTALAYLAAELRESGVLGELGILHVNHCLRGVDADADAEFVAQLSQLLGIPLFARIIDVGAMAQAEGGNVEAIARRERYRAADEALVQLCQRVACPVSEGRIFTAHTADDRVENFYMRSIVGTGPGGFRSMRYRNGRVCRPLLEAGREGLRFYLEERAASGWPVVHDGEGKLWREDATNAHTDRFRAYVRHEIVPRAKERNPHLLATLTRTMNLIADEDDMLQSQAENLLARAVSWLEGMDGCVLLPLFGTVPVPLARRAVDLALQRILGFDARVEAASVAAVLAGFDVATGKPRGGYVCNIQGNLAVSANKRGVRIEPMSAFRARRKRR